MSVLVEDASRAVAAAVTVLEVCLAFAIIGVLVSALMLGCAALVDRPRKKPASAPPLHRND
jgi:hypothetical protein